jgi:hypothetical protein
MSLPDNTENIEEVKRTLSTNNKQKEEIESIKTIYSSSSEDLINNIQNKDVLEKIKNKRRVYIYDLCELARSRGSFETRGRFEKITICLILLLSFFLGFYANTFYLISRPVDYKCHEWVGSDYIYVSCSEEEACTTYKNHFYIAGSDFLSINQKFKLYCDRNDLMELFKNITILFSPLSCFIFGFLSDLIGRRKTMLVILVIGILGFLLSFFGEEFTLFVIGNCCLQSFLHSFIMILYLYCNEILGTGLRSKTVGLIGLFYTLGQLTFLGIYEFMNSYKQLYIVQVICVLVAIPIIRFFRESPFFLAHSKQFRKLSKMLRKIMETNFKGNVVKLTRWLRKNDSKKLNKH